MQNPYIINQVDVQTDTMNRTQWYNLSLYLSDSMPAFVGENVFFDPSVCFLDSRKRAREDSDLQNRLVLSVKLGCQSDPEKRLVKCTKCIAHDKIATLRKRITAQQWNQLDDDNNSKFIQICSGQHVVQKGGRLNLKFRIMCCIGNHRQLHKNHHFSNNSNRPEAHKGCNGLSLQILLRRGGKLMCEYTFPSTFKIHAKVTGPIGRTSDVFACPDREKVYLSPSMKEQSSFNLFFFFVIYKNKFKGFPPLLKSVMEESFYEISNVMNYGDNSIESLYLKNIRYVGFSLSNFSLPSGLLDSIERVCNIFLSTPLMSKQSLVIGDCLARSAILLADANRNALPIFEYASNIFSAQDNLIHMDAFTSYQLTLFHQVCYFPLPKNINIALTNIRRLDLRAQVMFIQLLDYVYPDFYTLLKESKLLETNDNLDYHCLMRFMEYIHHYITESNLIESHQLQYSNITLYNSALQALMDWINQDHDSSLKNLKECVSQTAILILHRKEDLDVFPVRIALFVLMQLVDSVAETELYPIVVDSNPNVETMLKIDPAILRKIERHDEILVHALNAFPFSPGKIIDQFMMRILERTLASLGCNLGYPHLVSL